MQQPYSAAAWNSIWRQGALCVWWGSLDHQTALVVVTHWAPSGASAATYRHLEEPGNTCMVAHTQSCPHACRARVNTTCRTAALDVIGTSAGSSCWSSSGRPQGARSRLAGCLASPLTMHQTSLCSFAGTMPPPVTRVKNRSASTWGKYHHLAAQTLRRLRRQR